MVDKKILSTPIRTPEVGAHIGTITLLSGNSVIETSETQFHVQE
jgi:hypothetical protein